MTASSKKKPQTRPLSADDYEMLGREIENVVASGHINKKRLLFFSFVRGLATGAGSVVGASLILIILLWTLSGLEQIPLIGDIFENIRQSIEQAQPR